MILGQWGLASKDALAGNALETEDTNLPGHTFRGQRDREETNGAGQGKLTIWDVLLMRRNEEMRDGFFLGCPILWTPTKT